MSLPNSRVTNPATFYVMDNGTNVMTWGVESATVITNTALMSTLRANGVTPDNGKLATSKSPGSGQYIIHCTATTPDGASTALYVYRATGKQGKKGYNTAKVWSILVVPDGQRPGETFTVEA